MVDIVSPALIIDEDKCRRNIRHMAIKAAGSGVMFRPHFKTHQSIEVGRWFREAGVDKIAVSSLSMAEEFARDQWADIMVAFPVNIREIKRINKLASEINLSILIADPAVLPVLEQELAFSAGFYIKVDVGNRRSGFEPEDIVGIDELIKEAERDKMLQFKGFVAHAGQTYQSYSLNDVHKIYKKSGQQLLALTEHYRQKHPEILASWGDTPTCSLMNEFHGMDEIRPGNFVFYDLMQFHLASCDWDQIAAVVAAPVVAKQKKREEIVLYAGAVHLSKDFLVLSDQEKVFGEVVKLSEKGWERFSTPLYLDRLSQEHGIFKCSEEFWDTINVGDLVGIVPVHSCLTADLLRDKFYNLKTGRFLG